MNKIFCPNLNHPDAQSIINKVGQDRFYELYVENNYSIPNPSNIVDGKLSVNTDLKNPAINGELDFNPEEAYEGTSEIDMLFINRELFNKWQQDEIVDSLLFETQKHRKNGVNNVKQVKDNIFRELNETLNWLEEPAQASNPRAIEIASHIRNVIEHYDDFMHEVTKKLNRQDVIIKDISEDSESEDNDIYESVNNLYQKLNYSDEANFMQSSKNTASGALKIALSLIPNYEYENGEVVLDKNGNPKHKRSIIGRPTYEPLDKIWNDLLYTLYNVPIGEKLTFLENSINPKHREIARIIKSDPDPTLVNAFESVFSKQQAKFITINFSRADGTGQKSFMVFDTNRANADNLLVSDWYENMLDSNLVKDINGVKYIDTKFGSKLNEKYKEVAKLLSENKNNEALPKFKSLLSEIGIDVSMAALKSDAKIDKFTIKGLILNKFKHVFNRISGDIEEDGATYEEELEKNNPFDSDKSGIETLAKFENLVNPSLFEASFIAGDGKAKYSFVNNSYMSLQLQKLKNNPEYVEELLSTDFASGSYILNLLKKDPSFLNIFDVTYLDSLGNDENNQTNKSFGDMNNVEKELLRLAIYQNNGIGEDKNSSNIGYFISLTPSDKSTIPAFKSKKITFPTVVNREGKYFTNEIHSGYKVLLDQFMSEYSRVKKTYQQIKNQKVKSLYNKLVEDKDSITVEEFIHTVNLEEVSNELRLIITDIRNGLHEYFDSGNPIKEYHDGLKAGTKFFIFDDFNDVKELYSDGEIIDLTTDEINSIVKPRLMELFHKLTDSQIKYWKDLGIYPNIDNYTSFFDRAYMKKNAIPKRPRLVKEQGESDSEYQARKVQAEESFKKDLERRTINFAGEYALNQFVMMMNQAQIISGDPALHGKAVWQDKKKKDLGYEEKASIVSTWDNFFKRMAKDIAPGIDGVWKKPTYNTIFLKDLGYDVKNIEEYQNILGKASDSYLGINPADAQEYVTLQEHLDVLEATGKLTDSIREAGERLMEGGEDPKDINIFLQVMKPVYVNSIIEDDINKLYYIKSSAVPLIPALTKGLEIDKLRKAMEDNNIQRAAYESATKLGLQGVLNAPSEDGVSWKKIDINPDQIIKLSRDGFRIQQELPYHGHETHINEGSQGKKLILNNLNEADIVSYNGRKYTGREIKEIFDSLHNELIDRAMDKALEDMGIDKDTLKFKDKTKIESLLRKEAESRGFPISAIYSIQLVISDGKPEFKIPISLTNNAVKYESLLNSIITNRVIKNTLPGFTGVQIASSGFKRAANIEDFKYAPGYNNIMWVDPNDTELEYNINEDGSVYSDVLVPSYFFKGKDKINLRDPKYYNKEDGSLNLNLIPEELLTIIGTRIPTQGYNSMIKFRVKGFLPDVMGDSAVVPPEIVTQMGSDFDVDKLYFYRYNHKVDANGKISKIKVNLPESASDIDYSRMSKSQIENLIIQMFEDRLSDPSINKQLLEPNGFGSLPKLVEELRSLSSGKNKYSVLSTKHQNDVHDTNSSGKMGVAKFSLYSTFFRSAQDAKLSIRTPFVARNSNGEIVTLGDLYSLENIDGDYKSNVIMYLQSAAVDNAKEQLLAELNINNQTMDIAGSMAMLGYTERYIGLFLRQEYSVRFSNLMLDAGSITSNEYIKKDDVLNSLLSSFSFEISGDYTIDDIKRTISKIAISEENMMNRLKGVDLNLDLSNLTDSERGFISNMSENDILDYKVLTDLVNLTAIGDAARTAQSALNIDTKGVGASFAYMQFKINQITSLINNNLSPIKGIKKLFSNGSHAGKQYEVLRKAYTSFGNLYSYGSPTYNNILNSLKENGVVLNEKNIRDIYNELKSFILSNPALINLTQEQKESLEKELLYSKEGNIARVWADYSKTEEGKRNPLTKRIKPKFSTGLVTKSGVKSPNRLRSINTPASNDSADIDSNLAYLYDMFNSDIPSERDVAEKLVKYFIITGATYNPQSIGKYISFDILEKYGFSKKLRDIDKFIRNNVAFSGFVKQYYQNNPFKAKVISEESTPPPSVSYLKKDVPRGDNMQALNYFTIYDKKNRVPVLYMLNSETTKSYVYTKIPILGDQFTKKYNYNDGSGSYTVLPREELPKTADASLDKVDANNIIDGKSTKEILETLSESNNKALSNIAKDLLESRFIDNVSISTSVDHFAYGWFDGSNVFINMDVINSSENPQQKLEETLIEELLHAGTSAALDGRIELSVAQQKGVNRIKRLYEEYKKTVNQDELNRFISINNKKKNKENLSREEAEFYNTNFSEYYPLINVKEFVGHGLVSSEFREKLKSNNFWNRLLDLISDLIGLRRNDLDFLYKEVSVIMSDHDSSKTSSYKEGTIDESASEATSNEKDKKDNSAKEDVGLKIVNDYIRRLRASERRFKKKKRNLGKDAPKDLDEKISKIRDRIAYLEVNNKITSFIKSVEFKLDEIEKSIDTLEDLTDIQDAKEYLNLMVGLTKRLEFSDQFDEWNKRVDSITTGAIRLNKKFKPILTKKLTEILNSRTGIDYNVSTNVNRGLKDVNWFRANMLDGSMSSSEDLQAIKYLIESYIKEANDAQDAFNEEFLKIVSDYTEVYGNDYSQFLEKDILGKPTGRLITKYKDSYYKLTPGRKNSTISITKENLDMYEKDRKDAFETLDNNSYINWVKYHDPKRYVKEFNSKDKVDRYNKYTTIVPMDKYLNEDYNKLMSKGESDPAIVFYNFIIPILERNNRFHNQTANYIPEMSATAMDLVSKGLFKQAANKLKGEYSKLLEEEVVGDPNDIDIITGKPRLYIPSSMFKGVLKPEEKSYDLARLIEATVYQENTLKAKYKAEPVLNLYYSLLNEANSFLKEDDNGRPISYEKSPDRLLEQASFMIDFFLYNKTRSDSESEKKYGKATDALISYTRLLGMGWNPFSAIGNVSQGLTSNLVIAGRGDYFTIEDAMKANGLALNTFSFGVTDEAKKISKLMKKFDVFVMQNELNFGKSKDLETASRTGWSKWLHPFEMQSRGEYYIQSITMIATLLNQKIKLDSGEEISVYEGFDSNGNWKTEYGKNPFDKRTSEGNKKMFFMQQLIRRAISDVHGNYNSPIMFKKDYAARAIMVFRTWLPQLIHNRFGAETPDILTGKTSKGRYLSYKSFFVNEEGKFDLEAIKTNLAWSLMLSKTSTMSELDKANMRANLIEIALIAAVTLSIAMIRAMLPEDKEDEVYYMYALNTLIRSYGDLTFFLNYNSFNNITQSLIPVMTPVNNIINVLPATWNYITGDDIYSTGPRYGQSKLYKAVTTNIPFITQIDKNIVYAKQALDN